MLCSAVGGRGGSSRFLLKILLKIQKYSHRLIGMAHRLLRVASQHIIDL